MENKKTKKFTTLLETVSTIKENKGLSLGISSSKREEKINSFAQFIKLILDEENLSTEAFLEKIKEVGFIEDDETKYNGHPMGVLFKNIPIVVGGNIAVKIVFMTQGDGFILVIPENVSDTYAALEEDPSKIVDKNVNLALYAEIFDFDTKDPKLLDLIKNTYLSAGNSGKAFEFIGEEPDVEEDEESEEGFEGFEGAGFGDTGSGGEEPTGGFEGMSEPVAGMEEIDLNLEAYKKFKNFQKGIYKALTSWYNDSSEVVKKNTRVKKLVENGSVYLIEVDNKKIYDKLKNSPKVAKRTISKFGEVVRLDRRTQLVDSFTKNGKRYFVVAERLGNYWTVKREKLEPVKGSKEYFEPIQKEIIKLNRSSIRKESRALTPHKVNKKIVYTGDVLNEQRGSKS